MQHRAGARKPICEVQARAEMRVMDYDAVVVKSKTHVQCQTASQFHPILQISADLTTSVPAIKNDGTAIWTAEMHMRQSQQMRERDVSLAVEKHIFIWP